MIFYEIELLSAPQFRFAFTVDLDNYRNVFHELHDFLEISVIEDGDIIIHHEDGRKEMRRAQSLNCVCSDAEAVYSALDGAHQRHTTVGMRVKYDFHRRSTDDNIDIAELRARVKERNLILIPSYEPLGQSYSAVLSQLKRIASLKNSPKAGDGLRAISAWFSLLGSLTSLVLEKLDDNDAGRSPASELYASRAQEYIHEHYKEGVSVADIAEVLGISAGYLHNIFRTSVGMGITEYVNIYRVELAKQLIINHDLPLKDIAEIVGVSDPAYMSRLFRKVSGVSYYEFKKQKESIIKEI